MRGTGAWLGFWTDVVVLPHPAEVNTGDHHIPLDAYA
jgi:hypothetical protein